MKFLSLKIADKPSFLNHKILTSAIKKKNMADLRFRRVSTLIVKVTHRCNLDCLYCYEHITRKGEDMSLDTFQQLADKVLENSSEKEILFLFHGGEPMLVNNAWYEEAIRYAQQKAVGCQKKVKFSMQTNLLGLSKSKIDLFRQYEIHLGVSLDGVDTTESSMRGNEAKVLDNFLTLQKAGIKAGILTTINHSNYDKFPQICDFLVRKARVRSFKANVVTSVGRGIDLPHLEPEQIFEAQYAILEFMIATEGKVLTESNLSTEIVRFFVTEEERAEMSPTLCHEKHCGAGEKVLGITPNGEILPCGRFQWNESAYFLGNLDEIHTDDFERQVSKFHHLVPQSWYHCATCEARKVCGFGCQAFIVRSKKQANIDCLPTQMRYQYYQTNRDRLYPIYLRLRNLSNQKRATTFFKTSNKEGTEKTYQFDFSSDVLPNPPKKSKWSLFKKIFF